MKSVLSYFRVCEWYDSKIPMAAAIGLYALLFEEQLREQTSCLAWYGAYVLFCIIYFSSNYLINDYSDMEEDRIAGKKKVILRVNRSVTLLFLILLPMLGTAVLWALSERKASVIIASAVVYFLGYSYSVKGIRMKERGIWGLIFSSFAQRNTPVLIVCSYLTMRTDHFICWMVLCFANGLRYILIHQYMDKENDRRSGVHTYVADKDISIKNGIPVLLAIEIFCLVWLFAASWKIALPIFLAYCVVCVFNGLFVKRVLHASYLYSYACVPLADLYNIYIPLILTAVYTVNFHAYPLLAITVLYLAWPTGKALYMLVMAVRNFFER